MNYTYILTCSDGTFYCGWTNDLDKRVIAHNAGKGAKYTRPRRPVVLSYYETFETKEEAMRREYAIKRLNRKEKENLVSRFAESDIMPQSSTVPQSNIMPQTDTSLHSGRGFLP